MELVYSSSLNGASFLLYEFKQVVKYMHLGYTEKEIRTKAKTENIFQFENQGRINRTLPSIMRRAAVMDETLIPLMIEGTLETEKVMNLYAIMKTDLLFYEFMAEVISEKLQNNNYLLEKKDVNLFFTEKSEQSERVANWSDTNKEKLKRAYMQVLIESGVLLDRQSGTLNRLFLEEPLKKHLKRIDDEKYIHALGEE